jgi:hypothetical protein
MVEKKYRNAISRHRKLVEPFEVTGGLGGIFWLWVETRYRMVWTPQNRDIAHRYFRQFP